MRIEKVPSGQRAGRDKFTVNKQVIKPVSRAKLDRDLRHELVKQKIVMLLIRLTKERVYNIDAVIEGMVETADYLSFVELSSRERRTLQGRLMKFVTGLKA